ncbi:hypothetical protein H2200_010841 [Cladophialophora chaetospira]|uniref:Xylanolytic transcriptional activator regulatory domain-containing protein n=1 Tax=Cladophialophora chaetospira TaxID=386627 RepID=A0AA38X109_9EURO|nr:hypothetical protein H2200_010841 [Cladophialophora chaetospira]
MRGMPTQKNRGRRTMESMSSPSITTPTELRAVLSPETTRNPIRSDSADEDVGFLGTTAFNAVFTENQEHIPSGVAGADVSGISQIHHRITASRKSIQRWCPKDAIFVLEILRDLPHLEKIADRWSYFDRRCSIFGPWLQGCQDSIRRDLFDKFDLTRDDVTEKVCELLHANTEAPLKMPKDIRFCDFISHYTGSKLCWEAVGVFLTVCGFSLMCLDCEDKVLDFVGHSEQDKQSLLLRLLEASDACVLFCNETVHDTDLSFWLMIENCTYASQVLGDAHYSVWRRVGDVSTAVFARGLHAGAEASGLPLWLKEARRKGVAVAYALDKILCAFVGRPPRISKRYCNIELPLDLEFDELALEGSELAAVCAKLDANGWNTQKDPTNGWGSASLRLFVQESIIREDVLEVCLGPSQDNLREKAEDIINRCKSLYDRSPRKYSQDVWLAHSAETSFRVAREYLANTYNEFMIRRLLVRRHQDDPTELVLLAHKILATVIEMRNSRGAASSSVCLAWVIVLNGLPAAAVLALELLQLNVRVASHARIKQDLCVFISMLKWVHVPGEGNYSLADKGRKTLQHIMDKVLATEAPQPEQQEQRRVEAVAGSQEPMSLMDDLGVYDFSWLDASHFDQDFWDSLNSMEMQSVA